MERRARSGDRAGHDRRIAGERGASLVEIAVVIAVAGVLLGAALPGVAAYLEGAELRSASVHFAAALSRGRVAALTEGRTWRLHLPGLRSYALAPQEGDPGDAAVEHLPGQAFFAGATSGGDVRFFPSGLVDNATFTLGSGDARRRVVVNQRGRVTVE
jgi:type II secretory pathway pseudopilin PulG